MYMMLSYSESQFIGLSHTVLSWNYLPQEVSPLFGHLSPQVAELFFLISL